MKMPMTGFDPGSYAIPRKQRLKQLFKGSNTAHVYKLSLQEVNTVL